MWPIDNGRIYVTIQMMVDIREYQDRGGHSPFREWYDRLNAEAARKVTTALYRVGLGEFLQCQKCWCWCLRVQD
jgi:hypothetical protein